MHDFYVTAAVWLTDKEIFYYRMKILNAITFAPFLLLLSMIVIA